MDNHIIVECAVRAVESVQEQKLINFIEKFSMDVLYACKIDEASEMYLWNGKAWIENINKNNELITTTILEEFDISLSDEFQTYAEQIDSIGSHYLYELCGVFWLVHEEVDDDNNFYVPEIMGPSTDKEWLRSWMP